MNRREFLQLTAASGLLASVAARRPAAGTASLKFHKTISRPTLEKYLSRAVTHGGLCNSSADSRTQYLDDDIRMLTNIGAKFIGRAAYAWSTPPDDDDHFRVTAQSAAKVHKADPDMLLEACIFEAVFRSVEEVKIPAWAFKAFDLPVEKRSFRYNAMLYEDGQFHGQWGPDGSVPDMSRPETQLWFYYRARRYLDAGCEALHLGQVHLMNRNDAGHKVWRDVMGRIRAYASKNARRKIALFSSHTHGIVEDGTLLFDLHAYPLRARETVETPQKADLAEGFGDSIYGKSRGGVTPSGWSCEHLPYLVEVDNWASSGKGGQSGVGFPWVWGYDEISWLAHQTEAYRREWMRFAWGWVRKTDPNGYVQMPTRRVLADPVNGVTQFHANRKSKACPIGFNLEDAIGEIWSES